MSKYSTRDGKGFHLTKRSCVNLYVYSDSTSVGVRTGTASSNYTPSKLHIRKISDI